MYFCAWLKRRRKKKLWHVFFRLKFMREKKHTKRDHHERLHNRGENCFWTPICTANANIVLGMRSSEIF